MLKTINVGESVEKEVVRFGNGSIVYTPKKWIGKKVIVSFPNFGHWQIRFSYFISGRMPKSHALPYEWYNTPNIRLLTVMDFRDVCRKNSIEILEEVNYINKNGKSRKIHFWPNLFATNSIFVVEGRGL